MRDCYIPDLTERFPEGFGGVDMTDSYFPCETGASDYLMWEMWEKAEERLQEEAEDDEI